MQSCFERNTTLQMTEGEICWRGTTEQPPQWICVVSSSLSNYCPEQFDFSRFHSWVHFKRVWSLIWGGSDTSRWVAGLSRASCIYVSFESLNGLTSFFEWIQIFKQICLYHFHVSCLNRDLSGNQRIHVCCSFDIAEPRESSLILLIFLIFYFYFFREKSVSTPVIGGGGFCAWTVLFLTWPLPFQNEGLHLGICGNFTVSAVLPLQSYGSKEGEKDEERT